MALTDSLAAYFKLDEASGNRVDVVNGITLTDNNTVTSNPGKIATAAQFTAANSEYLSVTDSATMSSGDIDFTWAGWFYLDSLGAQRSVFGKSDNATVDEYRLLILATNVPTWYVNNTGVQASTFGACSASTWYFFVGQYDATNNLVKVSINNGAFNTTALAAGADTAHPFNIGANNGASPFMNGRVDELGFWKRLLTADEITRLYNDGDGFAYPFKNPSSFFLMF